MQVRTGRAVRGATLADHLLAPDQIAGLHEHEHARVLRLARDQAVAAVKQGAR